MKTPLFLALGLSIFCGAAHAQNAPQNAAPLRTLIVSGGPDYEYNQYAIESNARYVESLTNGSSWRRIHFADGKPGSRTISALQNSPAFRAKRALAWILDEPLPDDTLVAQASQLKQIDGASTPASVARVLTDFAQPAPGDRGLLYFTGHGSAGGTRAQPDYINTTFALWNDNEVSERDVARALRLWPTENPLFVVMVQCHSGGFANLIFQDGDPKKPLLDRDIAGFFSSTGERMAAGCTSEVNERDYQDFTTHFFAALSGVSRDGRPIAGADYDRDGTVSGSEAFAWAGLNDLSIDVPVTTSDAYLRSLYPYQNDSWKSTPYAQIIASAEPWQIALLDGLSAQLKLKGEARVAAVLAQHRAEQEGGDQSEDFAIPGLDEKKLGERLQTLKYQIQTKFPGLKRAPKSSEYRAARAGAGAWLAARTGDVNYLDRSLNQYSRALGASDVRAAMLERFARAAYTLVLENRLRTAGTPAQQAAFAKLRRAEGRNPLK